MSNEDNYEDTYDAPAVAQRSSSGGLIPSAGMVAALLAVLAWIVVLLGVIQVTLTIWAGYDQGTPSWKTLVYDVTQIWSAIVAWGVLMLAAVVARYIAHRDE